MGDAITLRDRHWHVVVAPTDGGSLRRCEFDGLAVLEPASHLERIGEAPRSCCYFPLIPYANRVRDSRFDFAGASVTLAENVPGTRHAMHGHGWQVPWNVLDSRDTACSLTYRREATEGWPWRYEGRQTFEVAGDTLAISLAIRNLARRAMPCGLGFHPFLAAHSGARLQLEARWIWNGSLRDFPRERVRVPVDLCFGDGPLVSDRIGTDHCFEDWPGQAVVTLEAVDRVVIVEGCDATGFVVVYVPGPGSFCVEPVTHAVDAMNLDDPAGAGLWTLEPGASRQIRASIRITSRDAWRRRSRTNGPRL